MTLEGDLHLLQGILIKRRSIYLSFSCRGPALLKTTWNIIKNCFYFAHCCTNFHSNQPKLVFCWWIIFLPLLLLSSHCSCRVLKKKTHTQQSKKPCLCRALKEIKAYEGNARTRCDGVMKTFGLLLYERVSSEARRKLKSRDMSSRDCGSAANRH